MGGLAGMPLRIYQTEESKDMSLDSQESSLFIIENSDLT